MSQEHSLRAASLSRWRHPHEFDSGNLAAERGTRAVMWITLVAMVVEIIAGWWFNSMALMADGWHMSSHAVAIGVSAFAYGAARLYVDDPRFAFGTWKIEVLGGFASALVLVFVALIMVFGSVERLLQPLPIRYDEAIVVAVLGLGVNLVCAYILHRAGTHGHSHGFHDHDHDHDHDDHEHGHDHHDADTEHGHTNAMHHDLNLRSAYLHVILDAATSVLAIAALCGGLWFGWSWLDAVMGIVGAALIANWSRGLLADTTKVLLDREMDHPLVARVRMLIEGDQDQEHLHITDLHLWRVGRRAYAGALCVATHDERLTADDLRARLGTVPELKHLTIEVQRCEEPLSKTQASAA